MVNVALPAASFTDTSLIRIAGKPSLSIIVTTPVGSIILALGDEFIKFTLNASLLSLLVSSKILIVIVFVVSPGANVKSVVAIAV